MNSTSDVVIIGSGILGASISLELSRLNWNVVAVDSGTAAGTGATRNSGAFIFHHGAAREGNILSWESYHYWKDWASWMQVKDPRGGAEFRECGCLALQTPENRFLEKQMKTSDELGILYEHWDTATLRERLPYFCLDSFSPARTLDDVNFGYPNGGQIEAATFWPQTGYFIDPQLAASNVQYSACLDGAEFRFGHSVTEILKAGGRVSGVRLSNGDEIHAPVVVNAAGPWSSDINRLAGADADMAITSRAVRQEVALVPCPDTFDFFRDGFIISDSDTGCGARPAQRNLILVFSVNPESDIDDVVDTKNFNRNCTELIALHAHRLAQRIPNLPVPKVLRGVVDFYDVSDDWIPIYDCSCVPGFYMACGTSGNQFRNAPATGYVMARLIEYCENQNSHDQSPFICHLPKTDTLIELEFFSRRRDPYPDSNFSVLA